MKRKNAVSIDIGSNKIKVVAGSFEKEKIYIDKAFIIDTPKGSFNDGRLLRGESDIFEIGKAIRTGLNENQVKCKEAIITVHSTTIIRRDLLIPKVKPKDMESMIKYEIEQYLPIDLNDYVIEYKMLDEKQDNKSRVLIAALPKDIAEDYYYMLNQLNLEPKALDINSNSVSKLFGLKRHINNRDYNLDNTVALIDIGYSYINITIASNGYYQFSRLISSGGLELDAAIADMYGISEQDAEKKKLEWTENDASKEAVAEVMTRWTDDIQRVFQYYKSRNANNTIDQIYLFGGVSNMKGIVEHFENATGVPTQKIIALGSVVFNKDSSNFRIERFINSIGALI